MTREVGCYDADHRLIARVEAIEQTVGGGTVWVFSRDSLPPPGTVLIGWIVEGKTLLRTAPWEAPQA